MWKGLHDLDRILRGEATRTSELGPGGIQVQTGGLALTVVLLGCSYGFCMGWFGLFNRDEPEYRQLVASTLKVPALFLLTLLITFPSLYVFNALVGSRLRALALLRLLIAALGVSLAVLASFGPIVAFFSVTTTSYPFMVLLNVALFSVAGVMGLAFLLQTLHRLTLVPLEVPAPAAPAPAAPAGAEPAAPGPEPATPGTTPAAPPATRPAGPLEHPDGPALGRDVQVVFRCWLVVFALVGAQTSWVLRPFIGNPAEPFEWFRTRQSNFFEAVWAAVRGLFGW